MPMDGNVVQSSAEKPNVRMAIDVGGTFTDIFVLGGDGIQKVAKVPSTANPIDAVMNGAEAVGVNWADVELFTHGTTTATNALITRNFKPAAMVTTKGFRDVLEIGRGTREDPWDAYKEGTPPYVRRRDRFAVAERINYRGEIVEPLDEEAAREVARILKKRNVSAVAVCFINAYINGAHELRMAEILAEVLGPDVAITTSHETHPEIFEDDRFSTTVANTILAPIIRPYARDLAQRTSDAGYASDVLLFHSGGGVMTPASAENYAARLAASGIAAGAIASKYFAGLCGYDNAIGLDMGGTSADISLAENGALRMTDKWEVDWGHPICFPSIEVLTIGAGGGSISWLDKAGSLRNGPHSAGSVPGPACYNSGGTEATNTDANIILGRVGTALVGGKKKLDREAAVTAMGKIGDALGLDVVQASLATLRVANANMADAVRLISIARGHDPRDFVLVAFGGAGPLHGADIARELNIPAVVVPPNPGVTSAVGCMLVDVQHDVTRMFFADASEVDPAKLETAFGEIEVEGRERLLKDGVREEDMTFQRLVDMRYRGQWRSLAVPLPGTVTSMDEAIAIFHDEYEKAHNFRREDFPVEVYRLTVRAIGVTPKPSFPRIEIGEAPGASPKGTREVWFHGHDSALPTNLYDRDDLPVGVTIEGPAIIDQLDSTTVVPPNATAEIDEWLNIQIKLGAE
ncbi:hydantoinase/oxoprolinase family protein [Roseivivax sediminis]|uniref:N-methylhydantoinase A n=1 Tax=Roseivivax sediminis TaxID=936889 RepID=A0A1I2CR88_9RHOB|nr:hydantoinase/oxoprolinase family protein [Roseivivax sediminis]SFE70831.1 N-methylhydantoinase A [Roseivivax sediminis]